MNASRLRVLNTDKTSPIGLKLPLSFFLVICSLVACGPQNSEETTSSTQSQTQPHNEPDYPQALKAVLDAHGGITAWRKMQGMSFEIAKEAGNEKHFVQLGDRRDRVEGSNFVMGFNGIDVWMDADTSYKGNPEFYHNLMFYFYAMPFVLADDGINYSEADPLIFEDVTYPGIRISYNDGVGTSPKDEYFLYYHPDSFQMAWLGYTVTYFSGEKSDDLHWIRYSEWDQFNGLTLPKVLTWFNYENALPTEARSEVSFVQVAVSEEPFPDELFTGP